MKPLLALIVIATVGVGACGSITSHSASHSSSTASITDVAKPAPAWLTTSTSYTQVDGDKDNDVGTSHDDTSNSDPGFGHPANARDRDMITALVKHYYAIALAGSAAKACSMIYSTLAEAVAEDYGQPGGPAYMLGAKTCVAAMAALFKHFHTQLKVEVPKLRVNHVLLKERHGMVILGFAALPEREIPVTREGQVWKMAALFDSELP